MSSPTLPGMEDQVQEAEDALEEDADRLAIVDTQEFNATHGYVKPGETPVACTDAFKPTLNDVLNDDGSISALFPAENLDKNERGYVERTLEPTDDDYLELLDELIRPAYTVESIDN